MRINLVFVSGTWCTQKFWEDFPKSLGKSLNCNIYIPNPKYHDLSYEECEKKIGSVGLQEYTEHICQYIKKNINNEEQTILVGHSLGGLVSQLVANEIEIDGLILLGSAPAYGMFNLYPTSIKVFGRYFLRWNFWNKPMLPNFEGISYIMDQESLTTKKNIFKDLVPDSGRTYSQMVFWCFDFKRRSKVNYEKIKCPVLVITGSGDKAVDPRVSIKTANKFKRSSFINIENSDHMYHLGESRSELKFHISNWLEKNFN